MITTVKTRKKHECRVCGEIIAPGEFAIRLSGFDCDGPFTIYMHPECEPFTKNWDRFDWESISPGEIKRPSIPAYRQVHLDGTPSTLPETETKATGDYDNKKDIADMLKEEGYDVAFDTAKPNGWD